MAIDPDMEPILKDMQAQIDAIKADESAALLRLNALLWPKAQASNDRAAFFHKVADFVETL